MDNQCVNPFVHRFRFRTSDYFKIIFGSLLLPFRFILILFLFIMTSMIAKLSNYLLDKWKLEKHEELKWRNYFKIPCVYTLRAMFFVAGFYHIKVTDKGGPEAEKEARIIIIAPHTSPFDLMCGLALDSPSAVVRHDAVDIPFFGNIVKLIDPVFVQRDSKTSRNSVMSSVFEKIKYLRIVFFPEGTCSNRRALLQFKPGAFKFGLPVQPVAVRYDQYGGPDTLSWTWDGPPAWKSLLLTFCRFSTGFELIKLPVYYPSDEEKTDPELYAHNVSVLLAREMGLPNRYYSFDDIKYLKQRVFRSPVCLKYLKVCDKISNQEIIDKNVKINNNFHSNGVNNVKHSHNRDKKQHFLETLSDINRRLIEKIEFNSTKVIQSLDDFISFLDLHKYPEICSSLTIKELYNCLKKSSETPNTTHFAVVLTLCDISEQNFWKRLENSFNILAKHRLNGETNTLSRDSFISLLWLAFGIDNISENQMKAFTDKINYYSFKENIVKYFGDCIEENARELIQQI